MILAIVTLGCVHPRVAALEQRVAALEADMGRLQGEPLAPGEDKERAATELFLQANAAWDEGGDAIAANALVTRLQEEFPGTKAAGRGERLRSELSVIGREVPPLSVEWVVGETAWTAAPATLVVFFEVWCPHCEREMPLLEGRVAALRVEGVQLVGLTKLTRSSTPETLRTFLDTHAIRFPIGKEDGSLSKAFEVTGIPAAALVKDGKVIWRGHPARLDDARIAKLVGG